tara:strand:+ start:38999 stop:39409 length:411 start_codon:yes stop_codon:yes gene_type:complete
LTNFGSIEENKAIIQNLYAFFKSGEGAKIAAIFHPKIEWKQMEGFPNGGTYIGTKEVFKNVFSQFANQWSGWEAVAEEFIPAGKRVFVLGYYKGKSIEAGKYMEAPLVHIYTLKNGLITHFRQYTDTHVVQNALKK